jgi:hypothetical protein
MQWHKQMYYALYFRAAAAQPRGGPAQLAGSILGCTHAANLGMLVVLLKVGVDPHSDLMRGVLVTLAVLVGLLILHIFTLDGEELGKAFETERAFVWGAGSLAPFAVYATLTGAFVFGVLVWAASVGGRPHGAG